MPDPASRVIGLNVYLFRGLPPERLLFPQQTPASPHGGMRRSTRAISTKAMGR